jgi:hypothetical protein
MPCEDSLGTPVEMFEIQFIRFGSVGKLGRDLPCWIAQYGETWNMLALFRARNWGPDDLASREPLPNSPILYFNVT